MLAVGLRKAIEASEAANTTAKSEEAVPCIREWLLSRGCHPLILFHLFSYWPSYQIQEKPHHLVCPIYIHSLSAWLKVDTHSHSSSPTLHKLSPLTKNCPKVINTVWALLFVNKDFLFFLSDTWMCLGHKASVLIAYQPSFWPAQLYWPLVLFVWIDAVVSLGGRPQTIVASAHPLFLWWVLEGSRRL